MKLNERVFKYYMNVSPFIDFDYTGTIEFLQCTIYSPLTVWGGKTYFVWEIKKNPFVTSKLIPN